MLVVSSWDKVRDVRLGLVSANVTITVCLPVYAKFLFVFICSFFKH